MNNPLEWLSALGTIATVIVIPAIGFYVRAAVNEAVASVNAALANFKLEIEQRLGAQAVRETRDTEQLGSIKDKLDKISREVDDLRERVAKMMGELGRLRYEE